MISKEDVINIAKQCYDPEIPVNIWDLGLIYDIKADNDSIDIRMTLTSEACPSAKEIPETLKQKIQTQLNPKAVKIDLTFDPLWTPERISEEGKKKLGIEE